MKLASGVSLVCRGFGYVDAGFSEVHVGLWARVQYEWVGSLLGSSCTRIVVSIIICACCG